MWEAYYPYHAIFLPSPALLAYKASVNTISHDALPNAHPDSFMRHFGICRWYILLMFFYPRMSKVQLWQQYNRVGRPPLLEARPTLRQHRQPSLPSSDMNENSFARVAGKLGSESKPHCDRHRWAMHTVLGRRHKEKETTEKTQFTASWWVEVFKSRPCICRWHAKHHGIREWANSQSLVSVWQLGI